MQFKQSLLRLVLILLPISGFSQSTFLPQGDKSTILLDRIEIRAYKDSLFNFSKTRPFNRKHIIAALLEADGSSRLVHNNRVSRTLSAVDKYNLQRLLANNPEYLPVSVRTGLQSKKPFLKNFYTSPANFYEVHVKDFDLVINPVIQLTYSKEKDNTESLFQNTRGLTLRGRIANKIGFATYLTDNQERVPSYVREWITARKAVPGAGFYKDFKGTGYDYFDARGYITFNAAKYIDVAFGYDRNFIGNGHRSLFLSDFGNSNLFLKLNTRIWKFNYQNLFMELHNADNRTGDRLIGKKYAAIHHLDVAVK